MIAFSLKKRGERGKWNYEHFPQKVIFHSHIESALRWKHFTIPTLSKKFFKIKCRNCNVSVKFYSKMVLSLGHKHNTVQGDLWRQNICSGPPLLCPLLCSGETKFVFSCLSEGKAEWGCGACESRQDPQPHPTGAISSHSNSLSDKGKTVGTQTQIKVGEL